ncbi:hypothetical protein HHI36_004271 [Cryptolaemus montrouzieri]|uniref:Alpha N-terminal protein methyltransferase 1 n=1 Tax=Cryptolaemus montrouzieri TaxID=559131 RepID=A0ABD2NQP6_9CUCU
MATLVEIEEVTRRDFYSNAKDYWSEVPPTIDGMLGGFAFISQRDIKGSRLLLKQLFHSVKPPDRKFALDCGAGIGRISKHLLLDLFEKVDLVDQNQTFLNQAEKYIGPGLVHKVGNFYCSGLQDFEPNPGKYDVIWMQWVLGHLTDSDLIKFFESSKKGLKPNGVIIVKENVTSHDKVELDEKDSSFTRPLGMLKKLFSLANLECYRQVKQHDFPNSLYSVYMFILKPIDEKFVTSEKNNQNAEIKESTVVEAQYADESNEETSIHHNCITSDIGNTSSDELPVS